MPRFRSHARAVKKTIALLALSLALLGGGCAAATPAAGVGRQPDPFVQGLPRPSGTPGRAIALPVGTPARAATPSAAPVATRTPTSTPTAAPSITTAPSSTTAPPRTAEPTETATATATGTAAKTAPPAETATPAPTARAATPTLPAATPTARTPAPAPTETPAPTATWTPAPTATQANAVPWDLARDLVGMWEYVSEEWAYAFDFFADGRAVVAQNGVRPYRVRGPRALAIQMPEGEWAIEVLDLAPGRLRLEGVLDAPRDFDRVPGTPGLSSRIVGLWLDESGTYPSLEFAPDGLAVGPFGRGVYEVASDNSVLIDCEDPAGCARYREYAQSPGTPLVLRVFEATDGELTLQGMRCSQPWTLERRAGIAGLAAGLLGRWEGDEGSLEFGEQGLWIVDDELYGRYEVLSESTLWTVLEGEGRPLVVIELSADRLAYAEWGRFYEDDLKVYDRAP